METGWNRVVGDKAVRDEKVVKRQSLLRNKVVRSKVGDKVVTGRLGWNHVRKIFRLPPKVTCKSWKSSWRESG